MKNTVKNIARTIVLLAGVSTLAVGAAAQTSDQNSSDRDLVDAIVVTGEKIERSLLETASSVSVVTAEEIEYRNLEGVNDLLSQVANVVPTLNGRGFRIRGISNDSVTGAGEGGLATVYIDGAPLTRFATQFALKDTWDIGQVEVFRGAQSASQGRDSLAGAVIIRSNDPVYETEFLGRIRVEEYNGYAVSGTANIPLIEGQVAARLSFDHKESDGFIRNTTFGIDDYERSDSLMFRGKILVEPDFAPDLKGIFTFVYGENGDGGIDVQGPNFFERQNTANLLDESEVEQLIFTWEMDYQLTDSWSVANITSYNQVDFFDFEDDDATSGGGQNQRTINNEIKLFTEELRLTYVGDRISATGGLYFAHEEESSDQDIFTELDLGQLSGLPVLNTIYASPFPITGDLMNEDETTNIAAFVSADYEVSNLITVNLGLRYDREEKDFVGNTIAGLGAPLPDPDDFTGGLRELIEAGNAQLRTFEGDNFETVDETYDAWLPSAGVVFRWTDNFTTVLQAKRAYRAGGGGTSLLLGSFSFDPEFAWTYEAGFRAKLFDNKLSISSNIFFMEWEDMQFREVIPNTNGDSIVRNASTAQLHGLDLDIKYDPTPAWKLFASLGYSDTEFVEFELPENPIPLIPDPVDFTGNEFGGANNWTFATGAQWRSQTNGWFGQFDVNYVDGGPTGSFNTAFFDERAVANANFGYEFRHATLKAYVRNLSDEEYVSRDLSNVSANSLAIVGAPRVFGIEARFKY